MATVESMLNDFAELSLKDRLAFLKKAMEVLAGGKAKGGKSTDEEKPKSVWQEHCARVRDIRNRLMEEHEDRDFEPKDVMAVAAATYDKKTKEVTADDDDVAELLLERSTERAEDAKPRKPTKKAGSVSSSGSKSAWNEHRGNVASILKDLKEEHPELVFPTSVTVASATYNKTTKEVLSDDEIRDAFMEGATVGEKEEPKAKKAAAGAGSDDEEKPKRRGPMSAKSLAARRAKMEKNEDMEDEVY